jgi:chemotaxis methyl-accepting protein methylase
MDKDNLQLAEDLSRDIVNNFLSFRYDICTCAVCKNDIFKYIMAQIAASAKDLEFENIEEIKAFCQSEINRNMLQAVQHTGEHPSHSNPQDPKKVFKSLLNKISSDRGLDLRNYHTEILKRRIGLRIQHCDLKSYAEYMHYLTKNPKEYDRLFETLCINVSEFFRDPPVWVTIQYMLENLVRNKIKNNQGSIKLWSAGCANGEEPYSLAIAVKEALRGITQITSVEIMATDVDKVCLTFAEKGVYVKDNLKNTQPKLLSRYFDFSEGKFYIKDEIKNLVKFSYLDLTSQQYPRDMDVLCCRNVFIYFNRFLQKQILDKFCASIVPGGYLVMGKSEFLGPEYSQFFEAVDSNARIFRKSG